MKIIFGGILIGFIILCIGCSQRESKLEGRNVYRITKVDSTGNYHLIYALRNDSLFKVVSKKSHEKGCDPILVNNSYALDLKSDLQDVSLGTGVYSARKSLLVNCYGYDSITTICFDDDCVRDLFHSEGISGLCLVE